MKARAWLAVGATFLLAVLPAAGKSMVEAGGSPSGAFTRGLGVLAPAQSEAAVVVPKDGLWRASESSFICADNVCIHPEVGPALIRREREPRQGQFGWRSDGVLVFSAANVGRQFTVRYQFRPRRVGLLKAATPTDYADAPSPLARFLAEELGARGFTVVPAQDVKGAAAALALGTVSPHALPPSEKLAALARSVNAACVLILGIAVGEHSRPDELDTGIPIPQGRADQSPELLSDVPGEKVDRLARPAFGEEPTLVLPITRYTLHGVAHLIVVGGATGTVVGDETASDSQRVRWRRFSSARRALVRSLATQMVVAWRESGR